MAYESVRSWSEGMKDGRVHFSGGAELCIESQR